MLHRDIQLHHLAKFLQIGAVHAQRNSLPQKWVGDVRQVRLQRNDAVLAGLGGVGDDLFNRLRGSLRMLEENRAQALRCFYQGC